MNAAWVWFFWSELPVGIAGPGRHAATQALPCLACLAHRTEARCRATSR